MEPIILIGILGSLASLISLLISTKIENPKWAHIIYSFLIVIIVGLSILYSSEIKRENTSLSDELTSIKSIEHNAKRILKSFPNSYATGENRGFILTSFAFIEKYKSEFPETYQLSRTLVKDGLKIEKSFEGEGIYEEVAERDRLEDGSDAMRYFLKGLIGEDD